MASEPMVYELTARTSQEDCKSLVEFLNSQALGQVVEINASGVQRLSALLLQVLLSAKKHLEQTNKRLVIASPSDDFIEGLSLLGLDFSYFEKGEKA